MAKSVDINDIARIAGVSRSTVSRVLTNNKNVKRETALKVREAMLHCNYKPNAMARGLVTGRMNIVALVVSDITSPFYSELVAVISASLREKGFLVSLYNLGSNFENGDEDLQALFDYGFAGVIIADARNEPTFGAILKSARCPVVLLNRHIDTVTEYDAIMNDNFLGGYLATRHLIELGHRAIAMLTGPGKSTSSIDRHRGYLQALAEHGITADRQLVAEGDLRYDSGYGFASMMVSDNRHRPSAIFAGNDM
ncbi:MAG: LacI family transcriptional regulator, partial [Planctomycetes bacterium]|nr:LacI family transcriptional regulator [Planctomycetota bacterium]